MKGTPISSALAGAAAGAVVVTWLAFGGHGAPGDPATAVAAPRAEPRPLRMPAMGIRAATMPAAPTAGAHAPAPGARAERVGGPLSDADLGVWLDAALASGYADRAASGQAAEQVEASLREFPGVSLVDVECGDAFCRASLRAEPGVQGELSRLFGYPPLAFSGGGFTAEQPDGTTRIYYARAGQSVDDLRGQASAAAAVSGGSR